MSKIIRIGSLDNQLGLWQANTVKGQLEHFEHKCELVKIAGLSDAVLDKPLNEQDTRGVFTKNLDNALINDLIDIAVYSLDELPTKLPEEIVQAAVLKRGDFNDVLVMKSNENFFANRKATIATGSLLRKAQWLYRYPNHSIKDLKGDLKTQIQKLNDSNWDAAIFSISGLKKIDLLPENYMKLAWMLPAPAQGTVMIATHKDNNDMLKICKDLNDSETEICVTIEREFSDALEDGQSAPVGALAIINEDELKFKGALFSPNGKDKVEFSKEVPANHTTDLAQFAAQFILKRGGKKLMRKKISFDKKTEIFSTKNLSLIQTSVLSPGIGISMSDFVTIKYNRLKPVLIKNTLDHVVFTSQHAVESILNSFSPGELKFSNIYCVGRRTKRLIEKNIGKVTHFENSEKKLAHYLTEKINDAEVTYFCGSKRSDELPDILSKKHILINEIECYKTLLTPNKVGEKFNGIIFYSPLGVESYLTVNSPDDKIAFCLGETTTTAAKKQFKNVITASSPTAESILKSLNSYFQEK